MATQRQEVVDLKLVRHSGILPEDKTKWSDWKFSFVNDLTLVDNLYSDELEAAEGQDKFIQPRSDDADQVKRSRGLLSGLASLVKGADLMQVKKSDKARNGFEAWRRLVQNHKPRVPLRELATLTEVLEAKDLKTDKDEPLSTDNFESGLLAWEELKRKYEKMARAAETEPEKETGLPEWIQTATLLRWAPHEGGLRDHLILNSDT